MSLRESEAEEASHDTNYILLKKKEGADDGSLELVGGEFPPGFIKMHANIWLSGYTAGYSARGVRAFFSQGGPQK